MSMARLLPALALAVLVSMVYAEDCALCKKEIPKGKGVTASIGKETRSYRCIHCALTGIEREKAMVTIYTRTPLDGKPIRLKRTTKGWTQRPNSAVFLILPERAGECLDVHQPFANRSEYDRYLKAHPEIARKKPRPYTISDYEKMLKAGQAEKN